VIEQSRYLFHLDLSGMNLRHHAKAIVKSVVEAHLQTLVSIHLHDNNIDPKSRDEMMARLGIRSKQYF